MLKNFGKEYLLVHLWKMLGCKIVVDPQRLRRYELMKLPLEIFTTIRNESHIEVVDKDQLKSRITEHNGPYFVIEPTAQRKEMNQVKNWRIVPLSDHCNYAELRGFVEKLKPKSLRLVQPTSSNRKERVIPEEFRSLLDTSSPAREFEVPQSVLKFMQQRLVKGTIHEYVILVY